MEKKEVGPVTDLDKTFTPCKCCSNILKKECFDDCVFEGDYKHFRLRPGTGIKDLPPFPIEDIMDYANPKFRLLVVSIYIAAITDYLQNVDDYDLRDHNDSTETRVADLGFRELGDG